MKPSLTPQRIDRAVTTAAQVFEVPRRELIGRIRLRRVVEARQAVYAALYRVCATSYPELASVMRRDHTTVIYGVRKIEGIARRDRDYAEALIKIAQAVAQ